MTRQSRTNSTNKLAEEKIPRLFFQLTLPAVFAQLVNMLYNMVDRMYISRIPQVGQIALTGVGVSMPLIVLVSAFANLVGSGGSPLAANALGAKRRKKRTPSSIPPSDSPCCSVCFCPSSFSPSSPPFFAWWERVPTVCPMPGPMAGSTSWGVPPSWFPWA